MLRDVITDRSAFDRIIQSGGFVSVNTGGTPDGNAIPVAKSGRGQGDGRGRVHQAAERAYGGDAK